MRPASVFAARNWIRPVFCFLAAAFLVSLPDVCALFAAPSYTNFQIKKCQGAPYVDSDLSPTVYTTEIDFKLHVEDIEGLMGATGDNTTVSRPPPDSPILTGTQGLWHMDESGISWSDDETTPDRDIEAWTQWYVESSTCADSQNTKYYPDHVGSKSNFGNALRFRSVKTDPCLTSSGGPASTGSDEWYDYAYGRLGVGTDGTYIREVFENEAGWSVEAWIYNPNPTYLRTCAAWNFGFCTSTADEAPILVNCTSNSTGQGTLPPANDCMFLGVLNGKLYMDFGRHATAGKTAVSSGWSHVVFTYDRVSNQQNVYYKGNVDTADAQPTGTAKGTPLSTSLDSVTKIGGGPSHWASKSGVNGDANSLGGYIDELRIFNKVLSADEVAAHYCGQGWINESGKFECRQANPAVYNSTAATHSVIYSTNASATNLNTGFFDENVNEAVGTGNVAITIDHNKPSAPVVSVSGIDNNSATWDWSGYECATTNTSYTLIRNWTSNISNYSGNSYTNNSLSPNRVYGLAVDATYLDNGISVGPSDKSLEAYATTYANTPGKVTLGTINSGTSLDLTINTNGNPTSFSDGPPTRWPTEYAFRHSFNQGSYTNTDAFSTTLTRTISSLTKGSRYDFKSRARNVDGVETADNSVSTGPVITQPNIPAISGAPFTGGSCPKNNIEWTWGTVSFGGGSGTYTLYKEDGTPLITTPGNSFVQTVAGPGTYKAAVEAKDTGVGYHLNAFSGKSSSATASTTGADIPEVVGLVGTANSVSSIRWTWNAASNLCSPFDYRVWSTTSPATLLHTETANTFWIQPGLGVNTTYSVRVSARDLFDTDDSSLSQPATSWTLSAPPAGLFSSAISTASMILSWDKNGNPDWTRYEITRSLDDFTSAFSTVTSLGDNQRTTVSTYTALVPQTTYYTRIRTMNGTHAWTGGIYSSFLSTAIPTLVGPLALGVTGVGQNSLTWTWSGNPTATITGYRLENCDGSLIANVNAPQVTYSSTSLQGNTGHCARVYARNNSGLGLASPDVTVYTDAVPPTGTQVTGVTTNTITLAWTNPNPGETLFEISMTGVPGFADPGFTGVVATTTVNASSVTLPNSPASPKLLPGTTYFIRVRTIGANGVITSFDATASTATANTSTISSTETPRTPYAPGSGTVGVWHFDEAAGTTVADDSGRGNTATLACRYSFCTSTPTFTTGMTGMGSSADFPGIQDSLAWVAHAATLNTSSDLTVQAWVKSDDAVQIDSAAIVAKGNGGQESFSLEVYQNKWRFLVRNAGFGADYWVLSTQTIPAARWTHVAGVFDSAGPALYLFVDGIMSSSSTNAPASRGTNTHELSIGNRQSGSGAYDLGFKGLIDEVHIQTRAVQWEISSDYAASQPLVVSMPYPNEGVTLTIPPNAIGNQASILVSSNPFAAPILVTGQIVADGLNAPPSGQAVVPNSMIEIILQSGGSALTTNLTSPVTLSIPYPDADGNLLVDGTDPPIPVSRLTMYTLDESVSGTWHPLSSTVDKANKRVAGITNHFSVFALFGPSGIKPDAASFIAYPVPWKPGSGSMFDSVTLGAKTGLAFDNLTISGTIRVFTLSGEPVVELVYTAVDAGTLIWDGNNAAGRAVASGVYFAHINTSDGQRALIKLAIER